MTAVEYTAADYHGLRGNTAAVAASPCQVMAHTDPPAARCAPLEYGTPQGAGTMTDPVLVLHFTQGTSIGGAVTAMRQARSECHEVFDPATGASLALTPWTAPARSLRHPAGTPDTNNRGWAGTSVYGRCYQVEIVGYSERAGDYSDNWYAQLERYLRDRCATLGVPYLFPCPFVGRAAYGAKAAQRLTWSAWAEVAGIVGHQHVPGNDHWDPGALDTARLTKETPTVPTNPPTATEAALIEQWQQMLLDNGAPIGNRDGRFGRLTLEHSRKVLDHRNQLLAQVEQLNRTRAEALASITDAWAERDAAKADNAKLAAELVRLGALADVATKAPALLAILQGLRAQLNEAEAKLQGLA